MKTLGYVLFLSIFAFVSIVPAADAKVIDHDKVQGFSEVTPVTVSQKAAKRFQPYLKVASGCVPFPAVDAQGNTSGGLEPTGAPEGHCSKSVGQVYSRSAWYNGVWAIMYAWYFPKDSPLPFNAFGHRHDWEGIVVWIDNPANQNPKVFSIAYSQHGKFQKQLQTTRSWKVIIRKSAMMLLKHRLTTVYMWTAQRAEPSLSSDGKI